MEKKKVKISLGTFILSIIAIIGEELNNKLNTLVVTAENYPDL